MCIRDSFIQTKQIRNENKINATSKIPRPLDGSAKTLINGMSYNNERLIIRWQAEKIVSRKTIGSGFKFFWPEDKLNDSMNGSSVLNHGASMYFIKYLYNY